MEEEELFINEESLSPDDDPVVSVMPVYLNNNLGDNLVLLQYPTRRNGQDFKLSAVRVKPETQVMETDLGSDMPSQYIDANEGSTLQGLRQTYRGIMKENGSRFAVGCVTDNALHISLVSRAGQMRPKFTSKSSTMLQPSMLQANSQQQRQPNQQSSLRSVQMSVKSTSTEVPKHSSVLEFWRQANKEENVNYRPAEVPEEKSRQLLTTDLEHNKDVVLQTTDTGMTFL